METQLQSAPGAHPQQGAETESTVREGSRSPVRPDSESGRSSRSGGGPSSDRSEGQMRGAPGVHARHKAGTGSGISEGNSSPTRRDSGGSERSARSGSGSVRSEEEKDAHALARFQASPQLRRQVAQGGSRGVASPDLTRTDLEFSGSLDAVGPPAVSDLRVVTGQQGVGSEAFIGALNVGSQGPRSSYDHAAGDLVADLALSEGTDGSRPLPGAPSAIGADGRADGTEGPSCDFGMNGPAGIDLEVSPAVAAEGIDSVGKIDLSAEAIDAARAGASSAIGADGRADGMEGPPLFFGVSGPAEGIDSPGSSGAVGADVHGGKRLERLESKVSRVGFPVEMVNNALYEELWDAGWTKDDIQEHALADLRSDDSNSCGANTDDQQNYEARNSSLPFFGDDEYAWSSSEADSVEEQQRTPFIWRHDREAFREAGRDECPDGDFGRFNLTTLAALLKLSPICPCDLSTDPSLSTPFSD